MLNRLVVYELVQAMKFKTSIPDSNLLMLINIVLQDVGASIPQNIIVIMDCPSFTVDYVPAYSTNISECMRLHLNDIIEFLTDFHTLAKIKVRKVHFLFYVCMYVYSTYVYIYFRFNFQQ